MICGWVAPDRGNDKGKLGRSLVCLQKNKKDKVIRAKCMCLGGRRTEWLLYVDLYKVLYMSTLALWTY